MGSWWKWPTGPTKQTWRWPMGWVWRRAAVGRARWSAHRASWSTGLHTWVNKTTLIAPRALSSTEKSAHSRLIFVSLRGAAETFALLIFRIRYFAVFEVTFTTFFLLFFFFNHLVILVFIFVLLIFLFLSFFREFNFVGSVFAHFIVTVITSRWFAAGRTPTTRSERRNGRRAGIGIIVLIVSWLRTVFLKIQHSVMWFHRII